MPPEIPRFIEGERAVLGACLLDQRAVVEAIPVLEPDHFYHETNRLLYQAIRSLATRNKPVDFVTVTEALMDNGNLIRVGSDYISELVDAVGSTANIKHYINGVKEKAIQRELIYACEAIARDAAAEGANTEELLGRLAHKCYDLRISAKPEKGLRTLEEINAAAFQAFCDRMEQDKPVGIPTGFMKFDNKIGGFYREDLTILGGRPSMGKTALAISALLHAASLGYNCYFFSVEMPDESGIWPRIVSQKSRVDLWKLRQSRNLNQEEINMVVDTAGHLNIDTLHIDDSSSLRPMDIEAKARAWSSRTGQPVDLIVVDYLQLMQADHPTGNQVQDVGDIAKRGKAIAKDLHCAMVMLSQLNRKVEERPVLERMPTNADLRASGNIEEAADLIAFMFRIGAYWKEQQYAKYRNHCDIGVTKNRNGPCMKVSLYWEPEIATPRDRRPGELEDL